MKKKNVMKKEQPVLEVGVNDDGQMEKRVVPKSRNLWKRLMNMASKSTWL